MLLLEEEPTYAYIEDGSWREETPYGTIHRLAGDGEVKGLFAKCVAFCEKKVPYLRADTHFDNHTMQHLLEKNGFERRGIYLPEKWGSSHRLSEIMHNTEPIFYEQYSRK